MKLILPAVLKPITRRTDRSVKLSFDTREMSPSEILSLLSLEGSEGYLMYAPNEAEIASVELPKQKASVGIKSTSELLSKALYAFYKQEEKEAKFVGTFQSFYDMYLEKYRQHIISKLHD